MNLRLIFANLSLGAPVVASTTFSDDFSSYGTGLTTGESTDSSLYSWTVINHVDGSSTIPITASGAQLAGRFPGHSHPKNWTAEADIVFTPSARPIVAFAELGLSIVERHEHTEVEIFVSGRATPERFFFSGTGSVRFEFTDTGINEYLNGSLQASRSYASAGWTSSDQISTIKFIGLHHDNGSIDRSYIDDISFTSVPEPEAAFLLVPSLMILVRRSRGRNPRL